MNKSLELFSHFLSRIFSFKRLHWKVHFRHGVGPCITTSRLELDSLEPNLFETVGVSEGIKGVFGAAGGRR
jgi:hypothetical protein